MGAQHDLSGGSSKNVRFRMLSNPWRKTQDSLNPKLSRVGSVGGKKAFNLGMFPLILRLLKRDYSAL